METHEFADRAEYLTEDAAYQLNWDPQVASQYFNFSEWETLPDDDTWGRIIDRITDLEPDENGNLDDAEIEIIISEEMDELSGQDLKDTRLALGLSQDVLADMLGVRQPTIHRWERGERAVPRGVRSELAGIIDRFEADLEAGDTSGPWGPVVRFWARHR